MGLSNEDEQRETDSEWIEAFVKILESLEGVWRISLRNQSKYLGEKKTPAAV